MTKLDHLPTAKERRASTTLPVDEMQLWQTHCPRCGEAGLWTTGLTQHQRGITCVSTWLGVSMGDVYMHMPWIREVFGVLALPAPIRAAATGRSGLGGAPLDDYPKKQMRRAAAAVVQREKLQKRIVLAMLKNEQARLAFETASYSSSTAAYQFLYARFGPKSRRRGRK